MPKAIHWPAPFRKIIENEDCETLFVAFRLGDFYYQGRYWQPHEVVDVRCNHRRVRQAVVVGDMTCTTVAQLTPEQWAQQKPGLRDLAGLTAFFETHYQTAITPSTVLSVVTYRNLPLSPETMDPDEDTPS
ncbi:MAG: hypothetical protein U0003_05305 [Vampirovibrionales bacterium]